MKRILTLLLLLSGSVLYCQENEFEKLELGLPEDSAKEQNAATAQKDMAEEFLKSANRISLYRYNDKATEFPYSSFSSDIIAVNYMFMPRDDRQLRNISIQYNLSDSANNIGMTRGVKREGKGIKFSKLRSMLRKELGRYKKEKRNTVEIYTFKSKDGNQVRLTNNTRNNIANLSFSINQDNPAKETEKDPIYLFGPDKIPIFKQPVTFDQAVDALKKLYALDKTDQPDMAAGGPAFNRSLDLFNGKDKTCLRVYMPFRMGGFGVANPSIALKAGTKIKALQWEKPEGLYDVAEVKIAYKFSIYGVVANKNAVFKFDPETGESEIIGQLGFNISMSSLAFHPDGTLWGFSFAPRERENIKKTAKERQEARKKGKRITGFGQQGVLYKINIDSGKGKIVQRFNLAGLGGGAGLEWDKKGENIYWSNSKQLCRLDIKSGKAIPVLDLKGGSYCLTRWPNGNLIGISIKDRRLFEIDLKKKKQIMHHKLDLPNISPSIAITQNNQIFIETFGSKIYFMKTFKSQPKLIGQTGVCPWGLAVQPKFNMKIGKSIPAAPEKSGKEGFGGVPKLPE